MLELMTGGHIKAARAFRGWTQKELAAQLGVSVGLVRLAEGRGMDNRTGKALFTIAERLKEIGIICTSQKNSPHGPWYAVSIFEILPRRPPALRLVVDND